jgi:hypothetical protein
MPRRGHLKRAKQTYGYLRKMKEARIRVLTNEPDFSDYQDPEYDWSSSVYGDVKEIIPTDIPEPQGKYVTLSHYFDANLYHDMVTGRSVTAILHFLNQTPMDWYSKKQATVETATFDNFRMDTSMVDMVPLIIWLVYFALMMDFHVFGQIFHCCQRIQQRQSYKL